MHTKWVKVQSVQPISFSASSVCVFVLVYVCTYNAYIHVCTYTAYIQCVHTRVYIQCVHTVLFHLHREMHRALSLIPRRIQRFRESRETGEN
jgi:hypothetical protein